MPNTKYTKERQCGLLIGHNNPQGYSFVPFAFNLELWENP